ncbi:class II aldolase/adducin family protein [Prodigiosinella aquatilis]|nr:class II aldolase/adducin family protein [Prodigiosinella sp. LS101]WJV54604.1 class II aldolase/adducin family protein [Prodigiosinella sp. LS101]WJV58966.1 class II aldolase/adducin family protein [Pectobacteriaceae bacterium C111]
MRNEINSLAVNVGENPLLVQGAGGNISWKELDSLYVKSSGTWLMDAMRRDIYVQMDLTAVRALIADGGEDYSSAVRFAAEGSRPSIETALHALLPQRVVLHLHPVDMIALSVLADGYRRIAALLDGLNWKWVDYAKPGKELAAAVSSEISRHHCMPDILVLGNHGLVVAAESVSVLCDLLDSVIRRLNCSPRVVSARCQFSDSSLSNWRNAGYRVVSDATVNALAFDERLMELSRKAWVLYPDHAVFLGSRAYICVSPAALPAYNYPDSIIVPGQGVLLKETASLAAESMLRCYVEVLLRVYDYEPRALSQNAIAELLNWDAEKFRQFTQHNV